MQIRRRAQKKSLNRHSPKLEAAQRDERTSSASFVPAPSISQENSNSPAPIGVSTVSRSGSGTRISSQGTATASISLRLIEGSVDRSAASPTLPLSASVAGPSKSKPSAAATDGSTITDPNCLCNNNNKKGLKHSSTLTDLAAIPDSDAEVELVTLIQEQAQPPLYTLRADTLTQFGGYENQDFFIDAPALDPNAEFDLSPETIEETLAFFVLSGERLSQMTKTYNDIDAVTRLLEEKERDLELAARIGQSLLEQNKSLKTRNDELESELLACNDTIEKLSFEALNASDRVTQLKHDLQRKNGLLEIYHADLDQLESLETNPESPAHSNNSLRDKTSLLVNWDNLHEKVTSLADENQKLREEAYARASDIELEERKELQLIHDCAKQLTNANGQLFAVQDELARRSDDSLRQQEEITQLLTQVVDLQRRTRDLTVENDAYQSALHISHECQNELSTELLDLKEKYGTLLAAFHELQEELKQRSKLTLNQWPPSFMPISESLAAEIESTLESEGYESERERSLPHRHASANNRDGTYDTRCHTPDSMMSIGSGGGGGRALYQSSRNGSPQVVFGAGGSPNASATSSGRSFLLSDKLKIVKSFEGSETLNKWRKLATPHLGVILEQHSGVQGKALKDLNTELLNYVLDSRKTRQNSATAQVLHDVSNKPSGTELSEELHDDLFAPHPGKLFDATNSTFTFTTTCLSQSTDSTMVTPSFAHVQLSTGHRTPIVSTSTTFSSATQPSLTRIVTNMGLHMPSPSEREQVPKTPAPSPTGPQTTLSPNAINFGPLGTVWGQSLRNKCTNYVRYFSGFDLSAQQATASEQPHAIIIDETATETSAATKPPLVSSSSFLSSNPNPGLGLASASGSHSVINKAASPIRLPPVGSTPGLGGMGDLATSTSGVVTKGYDASFAKLRTASTELCRPRSLALKKKEATGVQGDGEPCYIGSLSAMKTLRKGGFV